MSGILVIKPGSKVFMPNGERSGIVTAVTIGANDMARYNVAWWQDGTRHEGWLEAFEVTTDQPSYVPVGFAQPQSGGDSIQKAD